MQLTYNGQRAYFTIVGGCVSLILILCLSVFFGVGLRQAYFNPKYIKSPADYNYLDQVGSLQPQYGNTIAISLYDGAFHDDVFSGGYPMDVHQYLRVQYTLEYENAELSYPEAVWCDELYKDEIEKESQDGDHPNFSYAFVNRNSTKRLICPNITNELDLVAADNTRSDSANDGLLKAKTLTAKVVKCDSA